MNLPPRKKARVSTTEGDGGFALLHEETVIWKLRNFYNIFLATETNMSLLDKQHLKVLMEAHDEFPLMEWELSLGTGPAPDDEQEWLNHEENRYSSYRDGDNVWFRDNWVIFLAFRLVTPKKDIDHLDGIHVCVETDLEREEEVERRFPNSKLMELIAPSYAQRNMKILPLCTLPNREDVLKVESDGTLILIVTFKFYKGDVCEAEYLSKMEDRKRKTMFVGKVQEDFSKFLMNAEDNEVTLVAKNEETIVTYKNILKARSPVFFTMLSKKWKEGRNSIVSLDFPIEVLNWMMDFIKTGELKHFVVLKADDKEKASTAKARNAAKDKDTPCLAELIRFADMYDLGDLKDYFEFKMPSLCRDNPELAPYLNQLALEFSMNKAKPEIQKIMMLHSDVMLKYINENLHG